MQNTRSTPKETAILNKLDRLPVTLRRSLRLHQFDLSNSRVLCWYHSVKRGHRRYLMQCDVLEGVLNVSYRACKPDGKAFRMPKPKRFPGQIAA